MVETLVSNIIGFFGGFTNVPFGREIIVFVISLMPILELRGGLIAASLLGLQPMISLIVCFIGNILPVPFILLFITPIFTWLKKRKMFAKFVNKLESKALSKRDKIEKYEFWGLVLFVGIPLPGTGAWTGALIASLLDMNKKKAFLAILLGVVIASAIMMFLSFGLLKSIMG